MAATVVIGAEGPATESSSKVFLGPEILAFVGGVFDAYPALRTAAMTSLRSSLSSTPADTSFTSSSSASFALVL